MEQMLNAGRINGASCGGGMAQLFDPNGERNIICRLDFAARWCGDNSDWKFEVLS
jgi:hypothetical protein